MGLVHLTLTVLLLSEADGSADPVQLHSPKFCCLWVQLQGIALSPLQTLQV